MKKLLPLACVCVSIGAQTGVTVQVCSPAGQCPTGAITIQITPGVVAPVAGAPVVSVSSASIPVLPTAAAPTSNVAGGTFPATQYISFASTTPGALIYYTSSTDGSTPALPTTASSLFSSAIAVVQTTTFRAIAVAANYLASAVSSFTYTITPPSGAFTAMALGTNGAFNGAKPFAGSPTLYQDISSLPLSSRNAAFQCYYGISATSGCQSYNYPIKFDFSGTVYKATPFGIPYNVFDSATCPYVTPSTSDVNRGSPNIPESDDIPFPDFTCAGAVQENDTDPRTDWTGTDYSDHHYSAIDRRLGILLDSYQTLTRANGFISDYNASIWDMSQPLEGQHAQGRSSADAAGLPIIPFLPRPDEVFGTGTASAPNGPGPNHAYRFTLPGFSALYSSAGSQDGASMHNPGGAGGGANIISSIGMKLRLKASYSLAGKTQVCQILLAPLKTYGMVAADIGSMGYISGVGDPRYNDDQLLACAAGVHMSDLEWVDTTAGAPLFTTSLNDGTVYSDSVRSTGAGTTVSLSPLHPTALSLTTATSTVALGSSVILTGSATGAKNLYTDCAGPMIGGTSTFTPQDDTACRLYANGPNGISRSATPLQITVTGPRVAAPVIMPATGKYTAAQPISIPSATSGAIIHYTADGTDPTCKSPVWSSRTQSSGVVTYKAKACSTTAGTLPSYVATSTVNVQVPGSVPGQIQQVSNQDNDAISLTMTAGNYALISFAWQDGGSNAPVSGITCGGQPASLITTGGPVAPFSGAAWRVSLWQIPSVTGGATTCTVAHGNPIYSYVLGVQEFQGTSGADVSSNTASNTGNVLTCGSLTTTGTNRAVAIFAGTGSGSPSAASGYTSNFSRQSFLSAFTSTSSAGTFTPSIVTTDNNSAACVAVALKP